MPVKVTSPGRGGALPGHVGGQECTAREWGRVGRSFLFSLKGTSRPRNGRGLGGSADKVALAVGKAKLK